MHRRRPDRLSGSSEDEGGTSGSSACGVGHDGGRLAGSRVVPGMDVDQGVRENHAETKRPADPVRGLHNHVTGGRIAGVLIGFRHRATGARMLRERFPAGTAWFPAWGR